jgi:outer membrane protein assembly factor BamE (lipoprotein component of BamABCDE complex)
MIRATIWVILLSSVLLAQNFDKLFDYEKQLLKKISVGSTPQEVRNILGKPKAVEGGFPESNETIIFEMPKQVGQINNSTWFYTFPAKTYILKTQKGDYFINGLPVSKSLYESYANWDSIYFKDGNIVEPSEGRAGMILNKSGVIFVKKDLASTKAINLKTDKTYKVKYTPVLCVIFDKGTQVVALTKVYFMH